MNISDLDYCDDSDAAVRDAAGRMLDQDTAERIVVEQTGGGCTALRLPTADEGGYDVICTTLDGGGVIGVYRNDDPDYPHQWREEQLVAREEDTSDQSVEQVAKRFVDAYERALALPPITWPSEGSRTPRLIRLASHDLDSMLRIGDGAALHVDMEALGRVLGETLSVAPPPRVALESADYLVDTAGNAVAGTRTARGIWWIPSKTDRAEVGTWAISELALSVKSEGEKPAPVSNDLAIIGRATAAVARDVPDADIVRPGTIFYANGTRTVRVFVIQDARVCRPHDLLTAVEEEAFNKGVLGFALLLPTESGPAILRKTGW